MHLPPATHETSPGWLALSGQFPSPLGSLVNFWTFCHSSPRLYKIRRCIKGLSVSGPIYTSSFLLCCGCTVCREQRMFTEVRDPFFLTQHSFLLFFQPLPMLSIWSQPRGIEVSSNPFLPAFWWLLLFLRAGKLSYHMLNQSRFYQRNRTSRR